MQFVLRSLLLCSGAFVVLQAFNAVLQQQGTEPMLCLGHTSPCKGSCHWLPARANGCSYHKQLLGLNPE